MKQNLATDQEKDLLEQKKKHASRRIKKESVQKRIQLMNSKR